MKFRKFIAQAYAGGDEVVFPAPEVGLDIARMELKKDAAYEPLSEREKTTVDSIGWVMVCARFAGAALDVPETVTVETAHAWGMLHAYDFMGPDAVSGAVQENPTGTPREAS